MVKHAVYQLYLPLDQILVHYFLAREPLLFSILAFLTQIFLQVNFLILMHKHDITSPNMNSDANNQIHIYFKQL